MQTEGRRLGDHEDEVGPVHGRDHRAAGAGRRVDEGDPLRVTGRAHPFDERRAHGLADAQAAVDELETVAVAIIDRPEFAADFRDRPLGTDRHATAATVAEFREDEHLAANHGDGVEPADLGAFPAEGAFRLVHQGNGRVHLFRAVDLWFEKQVGVGFLDIAVEQLHPVAEHERQVGGHGGLAGAALAAGNADDHRPASSDPAGMRPEIFATTASRASASVSCGCGGSCMSTPSPSVTS